MKLRDLQISKRVSGRNKKFLVNECRAGISFLGQLSFQFNLLKTYLSILYRCKRNMK